MRPLRLRIEGFGPYARSQEIDFTRLENRPLFLIHGPTGSGKTTILDALSFALFGASSGGERQAKGLRCDFAPESQLTAVSLDFILRGVNYRIFRSPEQLRPKKRGSGTTLRPHEAVMWRLDHPDQENPAKVLASGFKDVTECCQNLLGFNQDQFRQVVVLPQGRFRRLLIADSKEREDILAVLFETDIYHQITEGLKKRATGFDEKIRLERQRAQTILEQAWVEDGEALKNLSTSASRDLQEGQAKLKQLQEEQAKARQAQDAGRAANSRLQEQQDSSKALAELKTRAEAMERQRQRLAKAVKAAGLQDAVKLATDAANQTQKAHQQTQVKQQELEQAKQALQKADEALNVQQAKEPQRQQARSELEKLIGLEQDATALAQAQTRLQALQQAAGQASRAAQEKAAELEALQKQQEAVAARLEQARNLASLVDGRRAQADQAARQADDAASLVKIRMEHQQATRALTLAEKSLKKAEQTAAQTKITEQALDAAWRTGQAAVLAASLQPGEPCPVCGSAKHPAPAGQTGHTPTTEQVDQARVDADKAAVQAETARQTRGEAVHKAETLAEKLASLGKSLGRAAETPLEQLQKAAGETAASLAEAMSAAQGLAGLDQQAAALQGQLAQTQVQSDEATKQADQAKADLASQQAVTDERLARLPENLRAPGALQNTRKSVRENMETQELALDQARQAQANAATNLAAAKAAHKAAMQAAAQATEANAKARDALTQRLKQAGFADEQDLHQARLDDQAIAELEQGIKEFEANMEAASQRKERADKAAAKDSPPDLMALEQSANQAEALANEAAAQTGRLAQRLSQIEAWLTGLAKSAENLAELDRRFGVAGSLAEAASGKNNLGMSLQRFVLASLLDEVLEAASRRLILMSQGRYYLRRDQDRQDRRKAAGLDLLVYDDHHGTERPVHTLSGGESFLASLALALGLAEVVQARAGGIQLDTIFIDEGFGSLDSEALDLAMQALADLIDGGRMVGVISHVEELKERMDARLEIIPGRDGSSARLVF